MKENTDNILTNMSEVIADMAQDNVMWRKSFVPHTLLSDFAKFDVASVIRNENKPFIWHVHWAGTYMHYLDMENISDRYRGNLQLWRESFEKHTDWCCTELLHNWNFDGVEDRFFFYDGGDNVYTYHTRRQNAWHEVTREQALIIMTAYGHALEARMDRISVPATITA